MTTWILLAVEDADRVYHGVPGYGDEVATTYRWDSEVPNHAAVTAGDRIVIRDNRIVLGASVIDDVERGSGRRARRRCPTCRHTDVRPRSTMVPEWRCYGGCGAEFDDPLEEEIDVMAYASTHGGAWVPLEHERIPAMDLETVTQRRGSILSIRRASSWNEVAAFLASRVDDATARMLWALDEPGEGSSGFSAELPRVRRGAPSLAGELIESVGPVCALSGPTPMAALTGVALTLQSEAGAVRRVGELLLRADLVGLLDIGSVSIDPSDWRVHVVDNVREHVAYGALHGRRFGSRDDQLRPWVASHWALHGADLAEQLP